MRYYIIAGEASGDLYGHLLIKEINHQDDSAVIRFVGGDRMSSTDAELFRHHKEISFMGYQEVIKNLGTIKRFLDATKKDIQGFNPDKIIYIDFPGFNLKLAEWAKSQSYQNIYFICPKIWAWKKNRYKKIIKYIDEMICIFPFEGAFLKDLGIESKYYGHPLVKSLSNYRHDSAEAVINQIAVLPGSRKQELKYLLPVLSKLATDNQEIEFKFSRVKHIPLSYYTKYLNLDLPNVFLFEESVYQLLQESEAAIVTSGTATLEAAIIGVPQLVVYKTDWASYSIAKKLVQLDYISLPNLINGESLIAELIQTDCTAENIQRKLAEITTADAINQVKAGYDKMRGLLQGDDVMEQIAQDVTTRSIA